MFRDGVTVTIYEKLIIQKIKHLLRLMIKTEWWVVLKYKKYYALSLTDSFKMVN